MIEVRIKKGQSIDEPLGIFLRESKKLLRELMKNQSYMNRSEKKRRKKYRAKRRVELAKRQ